MIQPNLIAGCRVTRTVARSADGSVVIAHHPQHGVVIVKVKRGADAIARAQREAAALERAAGAHVVRLLDVATTASASGDDLGCLVLERCRGGTLAELLRRRERLRGGELVTVLAPVMTTLGRLHETGVAHGGLSAARIAFGARGEPTLIGWGGAGAFAARTAEVVRERVPGVRADRIAARGLVSLLVRHLDPGDSTLADRLRRCVDACPDEELLERCAEELFGLAVAEPVSGQDRLADVGSRRAGPEGDAPRSTSARAILPPRRPEEAAPAESSSGAAEVPALSALAIGLLPDRVLELLDLRRDGRREAGDDALRRSFRAARARVSGLWSAADRGRRRLALAGAVGALVLIVGIAAIPAGGGTDVGTAAPIRDANPSVAAAGPEEESGSGAPADATAVSADDPLAAARELMDARERCVADLSILCLEQVFQAGSAALERDRVAIHALTAGGDARPVVWEPSADSSEWVVVERLGGTALVRLGPDSTAASLLLMKGEAGWRVRDYLAMSTD